MTMLPTVGARISALHSRWGVVDGAALLMRGVLGFTFVGHGAQKLFGSFGGGGIDGTTGFFQSIHIPAPHFFAVVDGLTEFFGGLLLIAGLLTVAASAALLLDMLLAVATFTHGHGFFEDTPNGGWELNLVLIGLLGSVLLVGAGTWSIDQRIGLGRTKAESARVLQNV
jgi:putative oxidoreductase